MNTYLIQRDVPGAGKLTPVDLKEIAQKSCETIEAMGPENIEWIHSYITSDNLWCVYKAIDEETIEEHGRRGEFPVTHVYQVKGMFSPATAGQPV